MGININCNYPGGNIIVESISDSKIKMRQDIRDSAIWWFYWNFCIENAQNKEIEFEFTDDEVVGPWGPAVSKDRIHWEWVGKESLISRTKFRYKFSKDENKVYFSFSLPYQVEDFERFYYKFKYHKLLQRDVLTVSEKGRDIPILRLGNPDADKHIFFSCRHHACESTAAYMLEGVLTYLLKQKDSALLRDHLIYVVPFVDIDGVEEGDQGKGRYPHDHNRDYIDKPIYKSTVSIMELAKKLNVVSANDFHSSWKWGSRNDYPFIVKQAPPRKEEGDKLSRYLEIANGENKAENKIIYDPVHDIDMGVEWNQPKNTSCMKFFSRGEAKLTCTIEVPYFGVANAVFTQDNIRGLGGDFAKAFERYISDL